MRPLWESDESLGLGLSVWESVQCLCALGVVFMCGCVCGAMCVVYLSVWCGFCVCMLVLCSVCVVQRM